MKKKTQYEKRLEYNNEYNRNTYKSFSFRLNKNTEKKLIKWIQSKKEIKSYIISLIEEDIEKQKKKKKKTTTTKKKTK